MTQNRIRVEINERDATLFSILISSGYHGRGAEYEVSHHCVRGVPRLGTQGGTFWYQMEADASPHLTGSRGSLS